MLSLFARTHGAVGAGGRRQGPQAAQLQRSTHHPHCTQSRPQGQRRAAANRPASCGVRPFDDCTQQGAASAGSRPRAGRPANGTGAAHRLEACIVRSQGRWPAPGETPRDASGRRSAVRIGSSAEQAVRPLEDRRQAGGRFSSSPECVPEQTGRGCAGWAASCAQHSEAPDGSRRRTRREAQAEAGGRRAAHRPSADRQKKRRSQPSGVKAPRTAA